MGILNPLVLGAVVFGAAGMGMLMLGNDQSWLFTFLFVALSVYGIAGPISGVWSPDFSRHAQHSFLAWIWGAFILTVIALNIHGYDLISTSGFAAQIFPFLLFPVVLTGTAIVRRVLPESTRVAGPPAFKSRVALEPLDEPMGVRARIDAAERDARKAPPAPEPGAPATAPDAADPQTPDHRPPAT